MITVKFYLKKPFQKKDVYRVDEVSIISKVTQVGVKGNRFELKTGEKIQPKHWDKVKQEVRSTFRGHFEINTFLQEFKTNILKLYRDNSKIDFDKFKALAQSKPSDEKKTLFLAYDLFLKASGSEKDWKTCQKYVTLQTQLQAFDAVHPIDLLTLDFNFYDNFKAHLYAIPNPNYKNYCLVYNAATNDYSLQHGAIGEPVGLFDDTIYKYVINLKTFLAWAEKRGYQVHQSYKSWEIIRRKHDPIALTLSELERLENHIYEWKSEDIARDFLVLQCRTGQRISDIKRFNLKDFSDFKWQFTPTKGSRLSSKIVTVHFKGFCAPALDILSKYNWKLPVISEQKINKHIKLACKHAGIDSPVEYVRWAQNKRIKLTAPKYEFISNHSGRRTFITQLLQTGVSIEHVMELTGITEYDTIRHYKGKFEDSAIEQALEKIPTSKTLMKKAQ
jgi:integrase